MNQKSSVMTNISLNISRYESHLLHLCIV